MSRKTIAIVAPGDMGHAVGRALKDHGHTPITCLAGRSERSRALAEAGGFRDTPDLQAMVTEADIVLSILPPAAAPGLADDVAQAMAAAGRFPVYVDCNAISPETAKRIGGAVTEVGAAFIVDGSQSIGAIPV